MSILAALILAVGACVAATLLFVPLQRLAEVLSELEIRTGAPIGRWDDPTHAEAERAAAVAAFVADRKRAGGAS
jgi:hypothetical protein